MKGPEPDESEGATSSHPEGRRGKRWRRRLLLGAGIVVIGWVALVAWMVETFGHSLHFGRPTAALVVLGAGVDFDQPSPVFEARLRHAVALFHEGSAPYLILTGGTGEGDRLSEAEVGRDYALAAGVPPDAILIETRSRTTFQNLEETRRLLDDRGIVRSIRIVSDPPHLLRATWMAHRLGLGSFHEPTPFTRYQSWRTRLPFILREVYFLHHFALFGE